VNAKKKQQKPKGKKMKKTLLSIIAGLAVVSSVGAAPDASRKREICEKHPEKYVWVEKDEFCAPINPCESKDETIRKAYCVSFGSGNTAFYSKTPEGLEMLGRKYAETVLRQVVDSIVRIRDHIRLNDDVAAMGFKTSDGGYFAFMGGPIFDNDADTFCKWTVVDAVNAHGGNGTYIDDVIEEDKSSGIHTISITQFYRISSDTCQRIRDFAQNLINVELHNTNDGSGPFYLEVENTYDFDTSKCALKCIANILH
jgi:hypothetical protein